MPEDYERTAIEFAEAFHKKLLSDKLYLLKFNIPLDYQESQPLYKLQEIVEFYEKIEKESKEAAENK